MAGSVIQATKKVEFEDCLWMRNQLKARNGLQKGLHFIWGSIPGADSLMDRLNSNLLRFAWLPGFMQGAGFDSLQW